jgi:hypothetical protein
MLTEARARIVDVETGGQPRAMRPLAAHPPPAAPKPPPRRTADAGPPKGPPDNRAGLGEEPPIARPEASVDAAGLDEVLWLEDSPMRDLASANEGDGGAEFHPWRRGLRD